MSLKVDTDSYDWKFLRTLNEDAQLTSNEYGEWDLKMQDGDYVNVTGLESLGNACVIAIMTRYAELSSNPLYEEFGCRVHELVKDNMNTMTTYKMEMFITETLQNMRRVETINTINVTKTEANKFQVYFNITSINDEIVSGGLTL